MMSQLPYVNRIEYFIQTKLGLEIPHDLKHDIACALYDYAVKCAEVSEKEKEQWKELYFKEVNKNSRG